MSGGTQVEVGSVPAGDPARAQALWWEGASQELKGRQGGRSPQSDSGEARGALALKGSGRPSTACAPR